MELVELQEHLEELEELNIRVVAVSVDPPDRAEQMRSSAGATFDFMSDPDGVLLDRFGLRHSEASPAGGDIAQSASFLLDSSGRVAWQRVAENYRVRPRPEEILAAARQLPEG